MRLCAGLIMLAMLVIQVSVVTAQDIIVEEPQLEDIAWSPDGTRIAGVYRNSSIAVWSVDDLSKPILTFPVDLADTIAWTPDNQYLIVQGKQAEEDGLLRTLATKWDGNTGKLVETLMNFEMDTTFDFNGYGYYIFPALAFDSKLSQAAFSFRGGTVLISDGVQVLHLEKVNTTDYVYFMEWSPDGQHLAVVYGSTDSYNIQIFHVASRELVLNIYQDFQYYIIDLAWNSSGTHLATSSRTLSGGLSYAYIGIYNIETDETQIIDSEFWRRNIERYAAPIAWHPTEYVLAFASEDAIEIYNPDEEEAFFIIAVDEAKDIEWSPDGTQIASVSRDGELEIWDVAF